MIKTISEILDIRAHFTSSVPEASGWESLLYNHEDQSLDPSTCVVATMTVTALVGALQPLWPARALTHLYVYTHIHTGGLLFTALMLEAKM